MPENTAKVFLATECSKTPVNFYEILQNNCYTYILQGTDRYAKSKLIDRLFERFSDKGLKIILIKNPTAPELSDGMILEDIQTAIIVSDERTGVIPKRSPVRDMGINIDSDLLNYDSSSAEILSRLYTEESKAKKRAVRFSKVASELLLDNINLIRNLADSEKISRFAERMSLRNLPRVAGKESGREYPMFFGALTPKGYIYYNSAERLGAQRVILLDDPHIMVSAMLISQIKSAALLGGYSVYCSYNPIFGEAIPDFIILKEAGLAIGRENKSYADDFNIPVRRVNCRRFYQSQEAKKHRERINFNRRASDEMLYEAVKSLSSAESIRFEITKLLNESFFTASGAATEAAYKQIGDEIAASLDLRLT